MSSEQLAQIISNCGYCYNSSYGLCKKHKRELEDNDYDLLNKFGIKKLWPYVRYYNMPDNIKNKFDDVDPICKCILCEELLDDKTIEYLQIHYNQPEGRHCAMILCKKHAIEQQIKETELGLFKYPYNRY